MDVHQEVLIVVADGDRYAEAIEQWRRAGTVTQQLPPRLALLVVGSADPPPVPGSRWYLRDVPADVLLDLSPGERIFVAAWRDRKAPKTRPGDGLAWDSAGFEPPDPPRSGR